MEFSRFDEEAVWYAPDYEDNRDLPKDERFEVLLIPLTRRQLQRIEESNLGKIRSGNVNSKKAARRFRIIKEKTTAAGVREVRNCTIRPHVNGVAQAPIQATDVKEALEAVPFKIIEDIYSALNEQSRLAEGVLGNSESQSAISA